MELLNPLLLLFISLVSIVGLFLAYRETAQNTVRASENVITLAMLSDILEQERTRISSELHDELGTLVSIIHLDLELVMHEAGALTPYGENKLMEVRRNLTLVTESIRNNIWNLSSQMFDQVDIAFALREMCHKLDGHKGTHVSFVQSGVAWPISQKQKVNIFRIVQELLTNAMKHSMAWNLSVHVHWERDKLIIVAEDDGTGYTNDVKKRNDGMGTINITKRANLIGAIVQRERLPKGSRSILTLKVSNEPMQI